MPVFKDPKKREKWIEKIREINIRKDLTKEIIYKTTKEMYEINKNISRKKLFLLVCKKLNCSTGLIKYRYGNFNYILKELNINIKKNYFSENHCINLSESVKNSEKWQKIRKSKEYRKNLSVGMKNSEKWQKIIKDPEFLKKRGDAIKKNFTIDEIGQNMLNKFKYEEPFSTNDFRNDDDYRDFGRGVLERVLRENNTTINELAKSKGVELIDKRRLNKQGCIGKNEKQIIDNYEKKIGYKIIRNYRVGKYTTDAFNQKLDSPVEVDEKHHFDKNGNQIIEDIIRENEIKKIIGCNDFIRIKDNLTNMVDNKQKVLEDSTK